MAQAAGRARDTQPALFSCILSPAAAFSCTPQPPSSDVAPLLSPPSVWQKGSLFRATPRQNPAFFREKRQKGPFFRGKIQKELGIIGGFVRKRALVDKSPRFSELAGACQASGFWHAWQNAPVFRTRRHRTQGSPARARFRGVCRHKRGTRRVQVGELLFFRTRHRTPGSSPAPDAGRRRTGMVQGALPPPDAGGAAGPLQGASPPPGSSPPKCARTRGKNEAPGCGVQPGASHEGGGG